MSCIIMTEERELIENCKENKRWACEALYRQYAPKLMGIALRYTVNSTEAEDILQDSYVFSKTSSHLNIKALLKDG